MCATGKRAGMTITTLSSTEFENDPKRARKAAANGPVFISDRGRPFHVLLTIAEYKKITNKRDNIADLLSMPEAAAIEIEFPRLGDELFTAADFS
jgi:prevent-host-death family protein